MPKKPVLVEMTEADWLKIRQVFLKAGERIPTVRLCDVFMAMPAGHVPGLSGKHELIMAVPNMKSASK